jgi:hypothetical protein
MGEHAQAVAGLRLYGKAAEQKCLIAGKAAFFFRQFTQCVKTRCCLSIRCKGVDVLALIKSKEIYVFGLNSERKAILEEMHKKGVIEVKDADTGSTGLRHSETAQSISQFDGFINSSSNALEILDKYSPEKTGLFSSREEIPMNRYSMRSADSEAALKKVYEIIRLADKMHENAENIRRIDAKQVVCSRFWHGLFP